MKFRYSRIIGDVFYRIKLTCDQYELVDAHFLAAAHHFHRLKLADPKYEDFHEKLMWQHVKALMDVVVQGYFSKARDTGKDGWCDLSKQESWIFKGRLPHPDMFGQMWEDHRYRFGNNHPYDGILRGVPPKLIEPRLLSA
jgi:hypothetical protein